MENNEDAPISTRSKLLRLMADRDSLEKRISFYGDQLKENGDVGMDSPLIDDDLYPRNDIDVAIVRQARQQIICLQNDHKSLMAEIETLLHRLHSEERQQQTDIPESSKESHSQREDEQRMEQRAIVRIDVVTSGSPAEEAGFKVGDEILQFGTLNPENFNELNQIADIVRHMQNQRIPIKVKRHQDILHLLLVPKAWSGRGLLGCNIVLP